MTGVLFDVCVNRLYATPAFAAVADVSLTTDHIPATADDRAVLQLARDLDRVLVTEDTDFGGLIYRDRAPAPPGIIFIAVWSLPKTERAGRIAAAAPEAFARAQGAFVTLGPRRIRSRPFPVS